MKDVSDKISTLRTAEAKALLKLSPSTIERIKKQTLPKGNALEVAKVAAIQAAKNTHQIIPYCHPLPIDYVGVEFDLDEDFICVRTQVKAIYKTGVEMEALTSASVAVLTIYDMVKMFDEVAEIESIVLTSKTGGKSDFKKNGEYTHLKAGVIVLSDSVSNGSQNDVSGKMIVDRLAEIGIQKENIEYLVLPDDDLRLSQAVTELTDKNGYSLVVTTGGTGISPTDKTFDCLVNLIEKPLPGVVEAIREYGQKRNPLAMLSRQVAGTRGKSLILSLPGSANGVRDALNAAFPHILHGLDMLDGQKHKREHSIHAGANKS